MSKCDDVVRVEIQGQLQPALDACRDRFVRSVRRALYRAVQHGVARVHFEVDPQGLSFGFPVSMYFLDDAGVQLEISGRPEDLPELMPSHRLVPENFEDDWDERFGDCDWETLAGEVIVEWLVHVLDPEIPRIPIPTLTVGIHDDGRAFDVVTNEWVAF